MEVEFPKPSTNINSMIVNQNPIKYVYHSSTSQASQRVNEHLPQSNTAVYNESNHAVQPSYQPYGQGNTNGYSYVNQNNLSQVPVQRLEGYQFSQYHQKNSYSPSFNNYSVNNNYMQNGYSQQINHHQDEQLL